MPPLPAGVRRPRVSQQPPGLRATGGAANRTYTTPALPSHRRTTPTTTGAPRGRSHIVELMPTNRVTGRGSRLVQPTTVRPRPTQAAQQPPPPAYAPSPQPPPPPQFPPPRADVGPLGLSDEEDSSDGSLTPTEDEFIEDGLGGSSFLAGGPPNPRPSGLGALDPCLADVLQRPRAFNAGRYTHQHQPQHSAAVASLEKSLEGYVIVESDGSGTCKILADYYSRKPTIYYQTWQTCSVGCSTMREILTVKCYKVRVGDYSRDKCTLFSTRAPSSIKGKRSTFFKLL